MYLQANVVPTGGAVMVTLGTAASGNVSLSRAVSGSGGLGSFTTLYSGAPLSNTGDYCYFLDIGDQTPGPLASGVSYVYQLMDNTGSQQTGAIQPVTSMVLETTPWTKIIIGIIQGAVNAAMLPQGVNRARVFNAMPIAGNPPLPLIAINPELEVQANIPIGADNQIVGDLVQPAVFNNWTQAGQERRMFRITVVSLSAEERDFWRTFVIGTLRIATAYALSLVGADFTHDYEATSYQMSRSIDEKLPTWFAADVLWDVTLEANLKIITNYGPIDTITAPISGSTQNFNVLGGPLSGSLIETIGADLGPTLTEVQVPIVSGLV